MVRVRVRDTLGTAARGIYRYEAYRHDAVPHGVSRCPLGNQRRERRGVQVAHGLRPRVHVDGRAGVGGVARADQVAGLA